MIDHPNTRCKIDDDDEITIANAALNSETDEMIEFRNLMSH